MWSVLTFFVFFCSGNDSHTCPTEPGWEKVMVLCMIFNPKPHGSGRICPHFFQKPITQEVLKWKKLQKIPIPQKTSAESKSRVMYPSKNINLCLFYASEQAKVIKKAPRCVSHLSQPQQFCPHPGGGVGWQWGGGGKAAKQGEIPFTAKMQLFIRHLSASQTSEHFLPWIKDVAIWMKILKNTNKIKIGLVLTKLWPI
jgi:hypothetical protein